MASSRKTGANERISTLGPPGHDPLPDYTDMAVWEAETDYDLVAADVSEVLEAYAGVMPDSAVYFEGAVTDSTHFRIIRPVSGAKHGGLPNTGARFVFAQYGAFGYVFHLGTEMYSQVQDISVSYPDGGYENINIFVANGYHDNHAQYVGCLAIDVNVLAAGEAYGFVCPGYNVAFVNCEAVRCLRRGFTTTYWGDEDDHITRLLNCNAIECDVNFHAGAMPEWANCLASGGVTADFQWTSGEATARCQNNASSDGTAPGANSRTGQTFSFVNPAVDDYHLDEDDEGAAGYGADLSADADFPFADDIDDGSRLAGFWDIGWDQVSDGLVDPATAPSEINDVLHILKDSCHQTLAGPIANRIVYRFARNYAEGKWDQELTLDDEAAQAELGEIKEEIVDLPWVRDAATALVVARGRLDWQSENAWRIELDTPLPLVLDKELTGAVEIDHHAILGGLPLEYKVVERIVDLDQLRVKLRAVRNVA